MRRLGEDYGANGYTFELVKRTGDICHYLSLSASSPERRIEIHEVFNVKKLKATKIFGRSLPDREGLPNNEDFGHIAWSYTNRKQAERKFDDMLDG